MTENNKPEWFEIAENDGPAALPKSSKALPMLAVFGAALIIGVGAVVAQAQEKSPVDPAQTASVSNSSSPATVTPNGVTSSGATASTTPALKNPSIAQLPTKGGDDDEDDEDEYEDEDEDEEDDD